MKIVADVQIPRVEQVFAGFGEIVVCESRDIIPALVRDADVLLIRSVTRVDAALLGKSNIRFVASATSGIDHIDTGYLEDHSIGFASAHGCNAGAVAEYVLSALCSLSEENGFQLQEKKMGIIGCGCIGSRLLGMATTMGMETIVNDPPLAAKTGDNLYRPLNEIFNADIISLHVPYHSGSAYPTHHLVDSGFLEKLKPGCILINTSRGGVVSESALKESMQEKDLCVILDVWENEPDFDQELFSSVRIGTPHIAGYSLDAKLRATAMIYNAVCEYFGLEANQQRTDNSDIQSSSVIDLVDTAKETGKVVNHVVLSHYDVRKDARDFGMNSKPARSCPGDQFDNWRKNYSMRREFPATTVRCSRENEKLTGQLQQLGFNVELISK